MFESILIANRGEIACRIARTAKSMGIRTIAVYSDTDQDAQHIHLADEAHRIGPGNVNQSYLDIDHILDIASKTKAEAIHPGYGFLSEDFRFAEAVTKMGATFIGPSPEVIRTMGLKHEAKSLMEAAGVPIIPGWFTDSDNLPLAQKWAFKIGYPILVKAVAGGGGRGIRLALDQDALESAISEAREEAGLSFRDNRLLIEKLIPSPRHIEVQILGDKHGNYAHLWERDCSLQRRYQKVIEEAPAPNMTKDTREAVIEAALKAAKKVGYQGVGTVEFILDSSNGIREAPFYFMEMNTRLQVEHPVTEMISGIDIVNLQIRIAAGETLPSSLNTPALRGHAIEARLYAEDPNNNFQPSVGTLRRFRLPSNNKHVRVDSGVVEGDNISVYYDSMLAKIIAHGTTRASAIRRLTRELNKVQVEGPATNISFLLKAISHPSFASGEFTTNFLRDYFEDLSARPIRDTPNDALALACLHILTPQHATPVMRPSEHDDKFSPWDDRSSWRANQIDSTTIRFGQGSRTIEIPVTYRNGAYRLDLPDGRKEVISIKHDKSLVKITIDGIPVTGHATVSDNIIKITTEMGEYDLGLQPPWAQPINTNHTDNRIVSPMPGVITQILVNPGAPVKKGQPLVRIEAMKMIHTLVSPRDGLINTVHFEEGSVIEEKSTLISLTHYGL
jgi:3-methylcrotonyl-CoA carboxylase alpha subunit